MRRISRRDFLAASAAAGALPLIRCAPMPDGTAGAEPAFRHGVASGDPLADRVMLWTRITTTERDEVAVRWTVARSPALTGVVARGEARTGAIRDYTVKVDVTGLEPGTTYYYRFDTAGSRSPVGRTRTLPAPGVARLRLAVVSCSNLPAGYFNAYRCIADRADLDAVLHLGDYIYEYENGRFGDGTALGRVPEPDAEAIALDDYRRRHAQYKTDPDLQAVHRQHPFITVWDDHDLANNAWRGGALNHNPDEGEGDWIARRDAAIRAYHEWMPIRDAAQGEPGTHGARIYRSFRFGDLADLMMLDTRVVGRDEQAVREDVVRLESADRTLLGPVQEQWLAGQLASSVGAGTRWQLLGQQVMFAGQAPDGEHSANADSWDGYRAARARVFDMIEAASVRNLAVLTGDVHSSWAYDLPRSPFDDYDPGTGRGSLGVEIVGTSVTSPSPIGSEPDGETMLSRLRSSRPHLHYVDGRYRGYVVLDVTRERLQADFYSLRTIADRSGDERFVRGFVAESGRMHLMEATGPTLPADRADPAP